MEFAIVAFPVMECADLIASVRRRLDPLDGLLAAHVTLVFPFADPTLAQDALERHVADAVSGIESFDITLERPTGSEGGYILMELSQGADRLAGMHDRLYSGPLARHRSSTHVYRPHVTIGRLSPPEDLVAATEQAADVLSRPLRGRIEAVAGFRLDEPWRGEVAFTLPLGNGPQ
jgi:2'-5' RNA ligase